MSRAVSLENWELLSDCFDYQLPFLVLQSVKDLLPQVHVTCGKPRKSPLKCFRNRVVHSDIRHVPRSYSQYVAERGIIADTHTLV